VAIEPSDYFAWYGPNGQVICYPIGDGSMLNIFAGRISREWTEESWSLPSSRQELLEAYAGWNEALLGIFSKVEQCFKWGIFDRDPRTQWTRGRVTLLGDAAHPTMPNLAQGANMAIEDGYVLARNLAHHGSDVDAALARYFAERQPRTSEITLQSRENFERTLKVPPSPPVDRSWIYSFDATLESA
jgi:salicylate hydroxylase